MEEHALRILEFHQFLQTLQVYALSEVGRALCSTLRPSRKKEEVGNLLREVAQASEILGEQGDPPLEGLGEVRPLLARARAEGACLLSEELLQIKDTLEAAGRTKQFLKKATGRHPLLKQRMEEIPEWGDLLPALQKTLGPRGEILDSASRELGHLRRGISRIRGRIRNALEALWDRENYRSTFQERIITLRNDRYVVAVRSEFKNNLPGIIHDQSQSKATFFIEPLSTVEDNNELNLLLKDEKEEERRILLDLTTGVREKSEEISRAVDRLGSLDLIFAKAKYGRSSRGTIPELNDQGRWSLPEARHPLLDPKRVVPVDLHMDEGQSTLIITGANAGGKTVTLKTLGLLTLMAQCGIPIPAAEGSRVAVFRRFFADIGDEQNLQENLSTFSAWIKAIAQVALEADPSSLVLLDEVGGGTDPNEGAALTMALIDSLRRRGAKTVITTHLHLLKAYGEIHPDVVNVSVEFNPHTLRPAYRLIYGRPGESYALLMAEKGGLPPELIDQAQAYLGEGDRRIGELLRNLECRQQILEGKQREADEMAREAGMARNQAQDLWEQTQKERDRLLFQAGEEARSLVRQAKEELKDLINEFKAQGRNDLHRLSRKIKEEEEKISAWMLERREGDERPAEKRKGSERTRMTPRIVDSLGQLGEVLAGKPERKKKEKPLIRSGFISYEIPPAAQKIKVIGLRVEEALPLVDKAIDEAILGSLNELEIVHGAGTGRLRRAIRDHLKTHPLVKACLPGAPGKGGDGVTVVEIRSTPLTGSSRGGGGRERWERS